MTRFFLALLLVLVTALPGAAQIAVPNTFTAQTRIVSADVNENFSTIAGDALNRTGGTMSGTLTTQAVLPGSNNTYDIGASGTRYANVYSVLGNFSGAVTGGAYNGQTISSAASFTGTLAVAGTTTTAVIVPDGNGTRDLGASGTRWNNVYGAAANFSGSGTFGGTSQGAVLHVDSTSGGSYGQGIDVWVPATNGSQGLAINRTGNYPWSLGFVYNSSVFAIGTGQSTESDFTEANASLTIQTTGAVKFPLQPGFLAYNSASDTIGVATATVEFNTETAPGYDTAASFNNTTDTFTAPVAGVYLLCATVNATWYNTAPVLSLVTTGATYRLGQGEDHGGSGVPGTLGGCVPVSMAASDTASVQIQMFNAFDSVTGGASPVYTMFSGRLLP